jgi:hypothetical protein
VTVSDIPSAHKITLIEVLTQTMRDIETAELNRRALAQASAEWQDHEISLLKTFLQDRLAKSWQHADECLMQVAACAKRLHSSAWAPRWTIASPRRCSRAAASSLPQSARYRWAQIEGACVSC